MSRKRAVEMPRYYRKLLHELQGKQLTPGLHIAHIYHDDWCAFLAGKGPCNCNPDMKLQAQGGN